MASITLHVPDMTDRQALRRVTARLRDLPGVTSVEADLATAVVIVHGNNVSPEQARAALAEQAPWRTRPDARGSAPSV